MKASRPSLRYKEEYLFFFGQILSKLNTSSKTMALIAMTLTFSMCLFLMIPFLIGWARGYLESRSVFSVQMFSDYRNMELDETQKGVRKDAYAFAEKYLKEKNIGIAGICTSTSAINMNFLLWGFPSQTITSLGRWQEKRQSH